MKKPQIFIDGEAGTTGLEIRKRLDLRTDIEILSIANDKRKDTTERQRLLNACDLAILCLPDDAAREAVSLITNPVVKVLDASTAYRTVKDWTYGFPELTKEQAAFIRNAKRVSNPGCYPTGAVALLRPLVDAGILSSDYSITINAVSGYSGGGKELIALCENADPVIRTARSFCLYGLDQKHKHIPEMKAHAKLSVEPIFLPSYSNAFYRGMLIHVVLRTPELKAVSGKPVDGEFIQQTLAAHYAGQRYIKVEALHTDLEKGFVLSPLEQNETNNLQLRVFWNADKQIVTLTACLDNLGKGASGAAVQNMDLMLGLAG
jgi:N-acetyl-gamma-glutamyl-phosphate reductase